MYCVGALMQSMPNGTAVHLMFAAYDRLGKDTPTEEEVVTRAQVRRAARTRLNACASYRNAAIPVASIDGKYVGIGIGVLNAPTIFAHFLRIVQLAFISPNS